MSLFILSAVSGTGKSTLARSLVETNDNWRVSVSHTTRAPRGTEVDGEQYHFRSKSAFENMVERGEFVEWATYVEQYYGTAIKTVQDALDDGADLLFDIEINGARQIKSAYPEAASIFLLPPSFEVLRARLFGRATDDVDKVYRRLERGLVELEHAKAFDYRVVNDELQETIEALRMIRRGEGSKLKDESERLEHIRTDMRQFLAEATSGARL